MPLLTLAAEEASSPNGKIKVTFDIKDGKMIYSLSYQSRLVILPSQLGIEFLNWPSMMEGFEMGETRHTTFDETWQPVWGEVANIRNHYNEMAVTVNQPATKRHIIIRFRVYDEGIGLRYELPRQPGLDNVKIKEEHTEFAMTGNHTAY